MRDLMTIMHTELILHYPRLYEKAHGHAPAQDQIDHFYNAPLDGKEATMNSLRRRVERKEAELKKITAAIEDRGQAVPQNELTPEEELRQQVERLKGMNARLVRRAEEAEATVQRLREVLR